MRGRVLGKASLKVFVWEGAKVVAVDISGVENDTAAEVGDGVLPVHCDVSDDDELPVMFQAARKEFGRVEAVLNVACTHGARPVQ
jgi:NAD(P)-dependent dehydrogenase (short-subunit alcohol dehydrogenase family)